MRFAVTWITLAALWIGLSGHFDVVHLVFGFLSVTLVTALSSGHLLGEGNVVLAVVRGLRLMRYMPWLLWQIVIANVDVMLRIFGIRPVEPVVIRFRPEVGSEFGRATLANSITLTPGTVTVDIEEDGTFVVHAISRAAADGVLRGAMAARVRSVEGSA